MAIPNVQWRLTLDNPAPFSSENGYIRTTHCADFRVSDIAPAGTFRDPQTGLVMLEPSILSPGFKADFQGLSSWQTVSGWWQEAHRAFGVDPGTGQATAAPLLATIKQSGKSPTLLQLLTVTAIIGRYNEGAGDTLIWGAQSNFQLAADQGFAVHYHGLSDEMLRQSNWFCLQWGGIQLHFDSSGVIRAGVHPGADPTQPPVLFDQFNISSPGEIYNRSGYFWFLPVPGIGLLVYHSLSSQFLETQGANASAGALKGHLIKFPSALSGSGVSQMLPASVINLGLNPYLDHILGFQMLSFPAQGVFTDAPFDPGSFPSTNPAFTHIALPTEQQNVVPSLLTDDGSQPWAAGDGNARVQLALSTTDSRYTPFVYGYQVQWPCVFGVRSPTPLQIPLDGTGRADRMMRLEFADDEYARFEGSVELMLGSAHGRQIAERGDATFLLEKSFDGGQTWIVHAGGLARVSGSVTYEVTGGISWYRATFTLKDFWDRLDEIHQTRAFAVDGLSIGDALNADLVTSGFNAIADLPPAATTILLPSVSGDQQYQFAPRVGDSGSKIAQSFLLFLRGYNPSAPSIDGGIGTGAPVEYRLRYDWSSSEWVLEPKPQDMTNAWTVTAFSDEEDSTTVRFEILDFTVSPPEFNRCVTIGVSSTSVNGAFLVQTKPAINLPSLIDATSPDFLGRLINDELQVLSLNDQNAADAMNARIYSAAAHRRLQPKTTTPYYVDALGPNAYVTIRGLTAGGERGSILAPVWVKRRSVMIEEDGVQTMTLEMDTQWLGEIEL